LSARLTSPTTPDGFDRHTFGVLLARAEPIRAPRGCYWCGHLGRVEPVPFVLPAVCNAPPSPLVCGWRCEDGLAGWADRLVGEVERAALRSGL
jgi:hypothetical protein